MIVVMLSLLSLACVAGSVTIAGGGGSGGHRPRADNANDSGGDTDIDVVPGDTGDTGDSTDTGDEVPPDPDSLFQLDSIHEVELTADKRDLRALDADPYTPIAASMTFDGKSYEGVSMRIKGRLGSYRSLAGKTGFKIDMNEFGGEGKVEGMEVLNFNNMVQDCAKIKERIAYGAFTTAGVPSPRVGYAHISVNGADYGLYTLVEAYDDEFVKSRFTNASGNLYDGDYYLWPNGSYTLIDFDSTTQQYFQLDEGTDVAMADIHAITSALARVNGTAEFHDTMGALVDLDEFADFWATEAWIGQYDGYAYDKNNYRVYFDPTDGKARFMAWDPDWAFGDVPVASPGGNLAWGCQRDAACHARFLSTLAGLSGAVVASGAEADLDAAASLIESPLKDDPRKETDMGTIHSCQSSVRSWISTRSDSVMAVPGI